MTDDTLISFGGAVKALGGGRVGGYLIRFTSPDAPDLTGEYFTADTDYWVEPGEKPVKSVIYHHGFDRTLGIRKIGKATLTKDKAGWWAEAQLDLRDEYERKIESMAKAGKLGWSSGSATHLYKTDRVGAAKHITSWPIVEATLTPIPADPHANIIPLKSWKVMTEGEDDMGEPDTAPVKCRGGAITVGDHVRTPGVKAGMCGTVKSLHTDGKHPVDSASEEAGEIEATEESPVARVHEHDAKHKRTGAVKSYPVKDLGAMDGDEDEDDEAPAKALDRYVRDGAVSVPFPDHSREVVSAVGGFVGRVRGRLDARVKAGRELSEANRSAIYMVCSALGSCAEQLQEIYDRTAPADPAAPGGEGKSIDPSVLLRLRAESISTDVFLSEHAR